MGRNLARDALGAALLRLMIPILALSVALFLDVTSAHAQNQSAPQCRDDLAIVSQNGQLSQFNVEIADTPAARAQGLMGRPHMPSSAGMLFVYPTARDVSFWMHDTLLGLDIIYIDAAGRVVHIARNAKPMDDTPLPSGAPVQFVLEINGGLAARLGIKEGALLAHPRIDQARAAFPCP
ncbi:DUF192 domain-containing protein [Thioclava sp. 15-R06ZXC-3]|uniref:DUF192 domain-containing protein n=1 Tax=Thioclava arctica TaxID=3238301 RepID=A0ABV3TH46_9RHOB